MSRRLGWALGILVAAMGLFPPLQGVSQVRAQEPEAGQEAVVTADRLNVRGRETLIGEVIAQLRKGDAVRILEIVEVEEPPKEGPTRWARIALPDGISVWVHRDYIDSETDEVLPDALNVRAGPGLNYSRIGELAEGETVERISSEGDWIEIEAPEGSYAFVAADYLERVRDGAGESESPEEVAQGEPMTQLEPGVGAKQVEGGRITSPATEEASEEPAGEELEGPSGVAESSGEDAEQEPAESESAEGEGPVEEPSGEDESEEAPADDLERRGERRKDALDEELNLTRIPGDGSEGESRRVVEREGIVKPTVSIQAPSYYGLDDVYHGRLMNYVYSSSTNIVLKDFRGKPVRISGEEFVDERWPGTPVLKVEELEPLSEDSNGRSD